MIPAHDDVGSGPELVLLHSGICDRRMWAPQVRALRHARRMVCPDLRGFGSTPMPGEEWSHADDVVDLLDHLEIARATVVGSSLGGRVALELATAHPDRVAGLVLLCPAYRMELSAAARDFATTEQRLLLEGDLDGAVAHSLGTWLGPGAGPAVRELVGSMLRRAWDLQLAAEAVSPPPRLRVAPIDLAAIAVPTLVVSGAHDLDHFQHVARHLARSVPGAEHLHLPWAGHLPSLERPAEVTALVHARSAR